MSIVRRAWGPTAVVLGLCALVYWPSLGGGFVYDDHRFVAHNPAIRSPARVFAFFTDPSTVDPEGGWEGIYRPLRSLSYSVDRVFFGTDPVGYRFHSLLLHAAASLAVAVLLGRLLGRPRVGIALGALFAVHPANVESVAWITSRSDTLGGLLGLLCLLTMRRRGAGWTALGHGWLALALFAKESAVVLPVIGLLLARMAPARGRRSFRSDLARWAPGLVLAVAYLGVRQAVLGDQAGQRPFWGDSWFVTAASMVMGSGWYVLRLIAPIGFRFDWQLPLTSFANPWVWVLAAGWLVVLVAVTWQMARGRWRLAGTGLSWLVIALAPVSNVVFPINIVVAERFLYLPAAGFLLLVGACATSPPFRRRVASGIIAIGAAVWLVFLAVNARDFAACWRSEAALWRAVIAHSPAHYRGYQGRAKALVRVGDTEGARAALLLAIARGGGQYPEVYFDLARTFVLEGRQTEAVPYLRRAADLWHAEGNTAKNRAYILTLRELEGYYRATRQPAEAERMSAWRKEAVRRP